MADAPNPEASSPTPTNPLLAGGRRDGEYMVWEYLAPSNTDPADVPALHEAR